MAYANIDDLMRRYDARVVGQLSSDDNSTAPDNNNIQAALDDATSKINLAALQGSQYTVLQLQTLVAGGDTTLTRMNCDLALLFLAQRRSMGLPSKFEGVLRNTLELLDMLRKGQRVLNVPENRVADLAAMVNNTAQQNLNVQPLSSIPFFGGPRGTNTTAGEYGPLA